MKKIIAALCVSSILIAPIASYCADYNPGANPPAWKGDMCHGQEHCSGTGPTKAKKDKNTGTIVMISVASAAVFAGAMWYIFKKMPSENNPGQVKLAEF